MRHGVPLTAGLYWWRPDARTDRAVGCKVERGWKGVTIIRTTAGGRRDGPLVFPLPGKYMAVEDVGGEFVGPITKPCPDHVPYGGRG